MKKILCFILSFFMLAASGCSKQIPKGDTSTWSTAATSAELTKSDPPTASPELASATPIPAQTKQLEPFYKIDMLTPDSGYAISRDFYVLKTSDGGKSWADLATIPSLFDREDEPALFALDEKTLYVASYTASGIEVRKSTDSGETWSKSSVKKQGDDFIPGNDCSLILSFANSSDGFLLASGPPALGIMAKALYRTSDGGNSWTSVRKDLMQDGSSTDIVGYTTGMAFFNANTGYITCTYHGQKEISLYKTADSGKSWSVVLAPLPEKYVSLSYDTDYYADAFPVAFYGKDKKGAKMELRFSHEEEHNAYIYSSDDGGVTWHVDGSSNQLVTKYCFIDDKNGFGLTEDGAPCSTKDGGITWASIA